MPIPKKKDTILFPYRYVTFLDWFLPLSHSFFSDTVGGLITTVLLQWCGCIVFLNLHSPCRFWSISAPRVRFHTNSHNQKTFSAIVPVSSIYSHLLLKAHWSWEFEWDDSFSPCRTVWSVYQLNSKFETLVILPVLRKNHYHASIPIWHFVSTFVIKLIYYLV